MNMQRKPLGNSGISVSPLGLGVLGDRRVVHAVWAAGWLGSSG